MTDQETAPAPASRRRVPIWMWGAAGFVVVLAYGLAIERMRFAPPLVMLALGGMTLAFDGGRAVAGDRSAGPARRRDGGTRPFTAVASCASWNARSSWC